MRLDKFLKLSRLVKRRTVANEFCDVGGVSINSRPAKASATIKEGDILTLAFGNKTLIIKVLIVPTKAPSIQEAPSLYETLEETWHPKSDRQHEGAPSEQ